MAGKYENAVKDLVKVMSQEEEEERRRIERYIKDGSFALKAYERVSKCPTCGKKQLMLTSKTGTGEEYLCKFCKEKSYMKYIKPGVLKAKEVMS